MPLTLVTRTHGRSTTEQLSTIPVPAAGRSWLARLFAGEVELPTFTPAAPPSGQRSLVEAAAVARALATPDLLLVDAAERTARESVIAAIVATAAVRGERALVLSPDPAAADRLVETLAADRTIRVVRALADDENPQRPSPTVTRLTSTLAGTGRADQMKREAALTVASLEAKLSRLERASGYRMRLDEINRARAALVEKLTAQKRAEARSEAEAKRDAALAASRSELATILTNRSEKQAALEATRRNLAHAAKKPGFFARLFGATILKIDAAKVGQAIHDLERDLKDLDVREANIQGESGAIAQRFEAEMAKAVADEDAALGPKLDELNSEAARIDLMVREFLPRRATPDDTVENGTPTQTTRAEVERELAVARTRLQELTAAGPDLNRRILAETQIVIGTPGSLEVDPIFKSMRPMESSSPHFGLLVLDHAEELTEPAFERLTLHATRWVLAGDAAPPSEPRSHGNGNGRSPRHRSTEPTLFARLAQLIDREPWVIEGDRLVFRLVHLSSETRKALTREPVLDHPHVELRVAAGGDAEPVLAEIAFPAGASIVQAKSFLFSQLGEVLLRPHGDRTWQRTCERLTACWSVTEHESGDWVDLEPGIREKVAGFGGAAFTAAISFDLAAGWDEEKAEAWLAARIPAPSASRLAIIPRGTTQTRPISAR